MKLQNTLNQTISTKTDELNELRVNNCCEALNLNKTQKEAVLSDLTLFFNVDNLTETILCFLSGKELL